MIDNILALNIVGIPALSFLYFFMWAGLGQALSILQQQIKSAPKIKRLGGFEWRIWVEENWKRWAVTVICMIVGVAFTPQLSGQPLTEFTAFMAGYLTDKTADSLLNRKQ